MKIITHILILLIIGFYSSCIVKENPDFMSRYFTMQKFTDSIYYDQTEVTVASWLSYYTWILEREGIDSALKVLPDSNKVSKFVWEYINSKAEVKSDFICPHTHQKLGYFQDDCSSIIIKDSNYQKALEYRKIRYCYYKEFPITGITYEQVTSFCKWRTMLNGNGIIEYRLPTKNEWISIAKKSLSVAQANNDIIDSLVNVDYHSFNYKLNEKSKKYNEWGIDGELLCERAMFIQDKLGYYDIFGNVSEMLNIKGIAKGGNFMTFANASNIDSVQYYNESEKWLGFRCIADYK